MHWKQEMELDLLFLEDAISREKKEDSLLVGNWCPHCLEESHYHCVKNDFSRTRGGGMPQTIKTLFKSSNFDCT